MTSLAFWMLHLYFFCKDCICMYVHVRWCYGLKWCHLVNSLPHGKFEGNFRWANPRWDIRCWITPQMNTTGSQWWKVNIGYLYSSVYCLAFNVEHIKGHTVNIVVAWMNACVGTIWSINYHRAALLSLSTCGKCEKCFVNTLKTASHERRGVSNHQHFDCLFNSF